MKLLFLQCTMYKRVQLNMLLEKVPIDVLGEQYRYESVDVLCNESL